MELENKMNPESSTLEESKFNLKKCLERLKTA